MSDKTVQLTNTNLQLTTVGITDVAEDWDNSMINIRYICKSEHEWLLKKAEDAKQAQQVKGKAKAPAKGAEVKEEKPTFDPNEPCDIA